MMVIVVMEKLLAVMKMNVPWGQILIALQMDFAIIQKVYTIFMSYGDTYTRI